MDADGRESRAAGKMRSLAVFHSWGSVRKFASIGVHLRPKFYADVAANCPPYDSKLPDRFTFASQSGAISDAPRLFSPRTLFSKVPRPPA